MPVLSAFATVLMNHFGLDDIDDDEDDFDEDDDESRDDDDDDDGDFDEDEEEPETWQVRGPHTRRTAPGANPLNVV